MYDCISKIQKYVHYIDNKNLIYKHELLLFK